MACVVQRKDAKQWFSELNIDMEKIFEITRHILYLYDMYKTYDEKDQIKDILNRVPKPRLSSSSRPAPQQNEQQQQVAQNQHKSNTNMPNHNANPNNPHH